MTTKPKAKKFRIKRGGAMGMGELARPETPAVQPPQTPDQPPAGAQVASPAQVSAETDMDAIRAEGLTGRQLRMARRVAQKQGIAVTSDFDAVRQLRLAGIDPFQRNTILELVAPGGKQDTAEGSVPIGRIQLPQTMPAQSKNLPSTERAAPADRRASEISKIQHDLAKRRRRKGALLLSRLLVFVLLPTFIVGWYYNMIATPMYSTKSEFVIQQAQATSAGGGGLGGIFQGTSMATQTDSTTVQSYLTSIAAMLRLDDEMGFIAHFSDPKIDPIQRLPEDATNEQAFAVYQDHVLISYDPTEGILRMEVIAADPETSAAYSRALIGYAEERVDQLTQRMREDQMAGARENYQNAEHKRSLAQDKLLAIQEELQTVDPVGETAALTAQISELERQIQQLELSLQERLNVARPNEAQVNSLRSQITYRENQIADIRGKMTSANAAGNSRASSNMRLRLAEEDLAFQTIMVQGASTQLETAQIEANRQVRYLSMGVEPVAPQEAAYPRAFQNTILAFLIFAGVYLMISLTASILREQVTS